MNLYILITKRIRIGAFKALSCNGNEMPTIKVLFKSFSIFPGKKKRKTKKELHLGEKNIVEMKYVDLTNFIREGKKKSKSLTDALYNG